MTSNSSVEPQISLDLQRVCEGNALHLFHTTARSLNGAAKSYAAQRWGDQWVERSLPVVSKHRRKRLFPRGMDSHKAAQEVVDELWDTYDVLVMLRRAVADKVRRPQTHREGMASDELVLYNNVSEAISLRMLISHTKSPPPANVISSLVAYGKVLGQLGCTADMKRVEETMGSLQDHLQVQQEQLGSFPPEAIRAAAVLTAYYHVEEALRCFCESHEQLASKFKAEELFREENKQRQMELSELVSFIGKHHSEHLAKVCPKFFKQYQTPLREFRNRLFHSPDALLPSTQVIGPNSFWKKYEQMLDLLDEHPLHEGRQHVDRMLTLTKDTKRKSEVRCLVTHRAPPVATERTTDVCPSDAADTGDKPQIVDHSAPNVHWIRRPQAIIFGREMEIDQIVAQMKKGTTAKLLLWGASGIGKSSLAMESAFHLRDALPKQYIFNCTTADTFMNSIGQFAISNSLKNPTSEIKRVVLVKLTVDFLLTTDPLLLVFDDVRCVEAMDFLSKIERHAVIATSQMELLNHHFDMRMRPQELSTTTSLQILASIAMGGKTNPHLNQEWPDANNAKAWMMLIQPQTAQKVEGGNPDVDSADLFNRLKTLLEDHLHNLPLAVEIFGHLLSSGSFETVGDLLHQFECELMEMSTQPRYHRQRQATAKMEIFTPGSSHPLAISGVVSMALEQLSENAVAIELLMMVTATACPNVPMQALPNPITDFKESKLDILKHLRSYGLLQLSEDRDDLISVFMHPFTQNTLAKMLVSDERFSTFAKDPGIQGRLALHLTAHFRSPRTTDSIECREQQQVRQNVASCACQVVQSFLFPTQCYPSEDVRNNRAFLDHLRCYVLLLGELGRYYSGQMENLGTSIRSAYVYSTHALEYAEVLYADDDVALVVVKETLGNTSLLMGDYDTAENLLGEALSSTAKVFGKDDVETALIMNNLSNVLRRQGHFEDAKCMYEHSLAIQEKHFGKEHVRLTATINNLSVVLQDLGHFEDARYLCQQALVIKEKHFGKDHVKVAAALVNLANMFSHLGQFEDARYLYKRAFAIQENHYGKDHPEMALVINNLGRLSCELGEVEDARWLHERALAIQEKHFGIEHVDVAATVNYLGNLAKHLGRFEDARELFKRALAIQEKHFGKNHVEVASTIFNLGNIFEQLGHFREARHMYERALAIQERHFGNDHFQMAPILSSLGSVSIHLWDLENAKCHYQRCLTIQIKHFGKDHVDVASSLHNLGHVARRLEHFEASRDLYEKALAIQEKHYGKDHVLMAGTMNNLGAVLYDLDHYENARLLHEQALAIQEKHLGKDHVDVALTLQNLGDVLIETGHVEFALCLYERALAIREKHCGKDSVKVAFTLDGLGRALEDLGCLEEAKYVYRRALVIKENYFGKDHIEVASPAKNLGIVLEKLRRFDNARCMFEKALAIQEKYRGKDHVQVARALNRLGMVLKRLWHFEDAWRRYERALAIKEKHLGKDHAEVAALLHNLGSTKQRLGYWQQTKELHSEAAQSFQEAKILHERALVIHKKLYSKEHAMIAQSLNYLGTVLRNLGKLQKAKNCFEQAMKVSFEQAMKVYVYSLNNLGNVLDQLGDPQQAKICYERALALKSVLFGGDHPEVATTLHNLGNALQSLGNFKEAKCLYERSLAMKEKHHGCNSVQMVCTLKNLSHALYQMGNLQHAMYVYGHALAICVNWKTS